MPPKSKAQAKFMGACSHGAGYDSCPPKTVAKEFTAKGKGSINKLPDKVKKGK